MKLSPLIILNNDTNVNYTFVRRPLLSAHITFSVNEDRGFYINVLSHSCFKRVLGGALV